VKRALGNRVLPDFFCAIILSLCFALVMTGCNNSSSPPPDTTPPTAPGSLIVTAASTTQINLSWTASTDNVGVTGYKVERCSGAGCSNFTQIATPTTTTYSDTGLTASTSYSYRVRAGDAAGNLSTYSNSGTVSTPPPPIQVSLSLTSASVQAGIGWQKFAAMVQNDAQNNGVTWTLTQSGANCVPGCGTLSANSSLSGVAITYTAPFAQPSPSGVTLTATSVSDTTKSMPAAITVTPPVAVVVAPTTINVQFNSIQGFTATVTNDAQNNGVTWTLTQAGTNCSPACGTLSAASSPSGTPVNYTGPSGVPANPAVTLTAKSVTDTARNAPAAITVTSNPGNVGITVSPKHAAITNLQKQAVVANITATTNTAVIWDVDGTVGGSATLGTVDVNGNYTPPATPGTHTVTATSQADITKSASSAISVTDLTGVTTYHNDLSRDGVNSHEFALTTANVKRGTFVKLFSCTVDGAIYAQPLWIPNLNVGGAKHNVVFVATQHNSLYAFDADSNVSPCVPLWHMNLLDTAHGGTTGEGSVPSGTSNSLVGSGFGDIQPEVGVTGTPVIDPSTNTLYVVSKSAKAGPQAFQRLHAIDLATGNEKFSGPVVISASVNGTAPDAVAGKVAFDPINEAQRPGLALVNGIVYIAWASHEDHDQYHGWVMGYNASTLAQVPGAVFNTTPNTVANAAYARGGIWMGGGAPAVDSTGNLYFLTGNGTFDAATGGSNYGDSTMKLSTTAGLTVADWFTPADQAKLDGADTDHGSGGAAILVDQPAGPVQHLVIGGGKEGNLFLLNRDLMGHYGASVNPVDSNAVQIFNVGNGIFSTSAFWSNSLYIAPAGGPLQAYPFNTTTGKFNTGSATSAAVSFNFPGATPSISASGASNGIVWAIDGSQYCTPQSPGCNPAVLHAFDASKLSTELWNSSQAAGDTAGFAVKFTVPTVANGRVYIGTRGNDNGSGTSSILGELDVYGLLPN
jgi:hypothetical protein